MAPKRVVQPLVLRVPIVGQDPDAWGSDGVLLGEAEVINESRAPGPCGARVRVIQHDADTGKLRRPARLPAFAEPSGLREYRARLLDRDQIERDPALRAANVYVTLMSVLGRFELALGRRIHWGCGGHQIMAIPEAFVDANAYYSEREGALLFGHFESGGAQSPGRRIFTCLSHDVLAHEASHALLDGLRRGFRDPSSLDQAAFHEAFSDLVALFSVFSMPNVVAHLLKQPKAGTTVDKCDFDGAWLQDSPLLAMAEQLGKALEPLPHRGALRRSLGLRADSPEYELLADTREPHRRAEILVAAVLRGFVEMWKRALWGSEQQGTRHVSLELVVREGCELAERLIVMLIRAVDYTPVIDLQFSDYVRALVTADREVCPRDDKYDARRILVEQFRSYGIPVDDATNAIWDPPSEKLRYDHVHLDAMRSDPNEVFRFIWENRAPLGIDTHAHTTVQSVRPCTRQSSDGFWLRETVCEYVQVLTVAPSDVASVRLSSREKGLSHERLVRPEGVPPTEPIVLKGGGVLVFDEYGRLKYHIGSGVRSFRQNARLRARAEAGMLLRAKREQLYFAALHGGTQRLTVDLSAWRVHEET